MQLNMVSCIDAKLCKLCGSIKALDMIGIIEACLLLGFGQLDWAVSLAASVLWTACIAGGSADQVTEMYN